MSENNSTLTYGSVDEAETAWLINAYDRVLDGWEYLGSGVHRSAYLSPSKVVYKVAHASAAARQAQFAEVLAVRILSAEVPPAGFGVPKADLVEVAPGAPVIAMEYVEGVGEYVYGEEGETAERFFRNSDCHAGNMIRRSSDGLLYMIDLGFFEEEYDPENPICSCCRPCNECGEAGCMGRCLFCATCGEEDCICCDMCFQPRDGYGCDCCMDCEERAGDCCCDFCEVCTRHKDDCDMDNCTSPFA